MRAEAERFIARGMVPIPIPLRTKAPDFLHWQRVTRETALERFNGAECNYGVLLGEPSGWVVDIDLDCPEAVAIASEFLPATATFGRASSRRSHWLYRASGATTEKFVYRRMVNGKPKGDTILELRSTGCQTVFPPSVHESGEAIAFDGDDEPVVSNAEQLQRAVRKLAAAALLMRHGGLNDAAALEAVSIGAWAPGVPHDVAELARQWLGIAAPLPAPSAPRPAPAPSIASAIASFNRDHVLDLPRNSAPCPVCCDKASFGQMPGDDQRWYCFSTDHPDGIGIHGPNGYHGDSLDLYAHENGVKPIDVLRKLNYLSPPRATAPSARADGAPAADVVPIDHGKRVYRNNSYLTTLQLIEANDRNILGPDARLEFNEMAGQMMLNRQPLDEVNESTVRGEIERCFAGGVDPSGAQKGMKQSTADIHSALLQVARGRPYHPVREYLLALHWDGVARLDSVAEDILGTERTVLNQALVRRYMVSAVARAVLPGCKVDTALILVGPTGLGKSTFFRVLGGEWFIDTALDITNPKSMQVLRYAWIYEWAELEVLRRAKDINAAKGWVSSSTDNYIPMYGRRPVDVPRGFVVAGTTETTEFLVDEKGNRRWWPLRVTAVDRAALRAQRDQLWAEARHIYDAWSSAGADVECTPWVLSQDEGGALDTIHEEHQTTDPWDDAVWEWAERQLVAFTTADVLEQVIHKPRAQCQRGDDMRVAAILKRARPPWKLGPKPKGRSRTWTR
jgi:predicted P-loop ATPase